MNPDQLTFWSEEPPASPSALPDGAKVWKTPVVNLCIRTLESLNVSGLDGSFGKTSPVSSAVTEDETLVPSSKGWGTWGMVSHGGCWTLNGAEWTGSQKPSRNDGDVSSLSDVLETHNVPPKYFLSAKACSGILRRAEKRGKELPQLLKQALEQTSQQP